MDHQEQIVSNEHKDFWDSLQLDLFAANQEISTQDLRAFMERGFMFSLFFKGCPACEIVGFQKILNIKNNCYIILMEFSEEHKANSLYNVITDEFNLHHYIKKILQHKYNTIGPYIANRIIILISEDLTITEQEHKEESLSLCHELVKKIENEFSVKVTAGIGSMQSIHSIYTSFIEAMGCLYYGNSSNIMYYKYLNPSLEKVDFDFSITEKRLMDAVRLRKVEAYDYFGLIMNYIKPFSDATKRNKIFEVLVLANYAMNQDSQNEVKYVDYSGSIMQLIECSGNQLIDCAYQNFIYITSYVKPQNSIDYTNPIVMATKEYLESHYTEDISLENMATQVNISPQYFSKLIKKTTGFNFIDWLSMLRVKKAKELLTNSSLTVKEVCFMVGYKDPNYFSRIFKKRIGITPSEYVKASNLTNDK